MTGRMAWTDTAPMAAAAELEREIATNGFAVVPGLLGERELTVMRIAC